MKASIDNILWRRLAELIGSGLAPIIDLLEQ
jgi:hypothetical protein